MCVALGFTSHVFNSQSPPRHVYCKGSNDTFPFCPFGIPGIMCCRVFYFQICYRTQCVTETINYLFLNVKMKETIFTYVLAIFSPQRSVQLPVSPGITLPPHTKPPSAFLTVQISEQRILRRVCVCLWVRLSTGKHLYFTLIFLRIISLTV